MFARPFGPTNLIGAGLPNLIGASGLRLEGRQTVATKPDFCPILEMCQRLQERSRIRRTLASSRLSGQSGSAPRTSRSGKSAWESGMIAPSFAPAPAKNLP